jgi:hypothetical protein
MDVRYKFNIAHNGSRWLKSRIAEYALRSRPQIMQLLFPNTQIFGLSEQLPFLGKQPKGSHCLASDTIRLLQGRSRCTPGFGSEMSLSFAKFLCETEIRILTKLYPLDGHPSFDFIGIKAIPERSYYSTINIKTCYEHLTHSGIYATEVIRHYEGGQYERNKRYKNAFKELLEYEQNKLGINVTITEKFTIDLKSSTQGSIALSNNQKTLIPELTNNGFKIYVLLAHFKPNWEIEFSLKEIR